MMEPNCLTVGAFQSNCYVLGPGLDGTVLVIDPGAEGERIRDFILETGGTLAAILLTHAHLDHIGAVAMIKRQFDAPIYLHPNDLPLYKSAAEQGAAFGLVVETPPPPNIEFRHGDIVNFGPFEFEVRHTPGHSPGSVTLVAERGAFVGDCVFSGSVGRTDLEGGDTETLLSAIVREILSLPMQTKLFTGHGPATTVAAEAATNPFLVGLLEPCQRCGAPLAPRLAGCKGGHCVHCDHLYPHGDCSDF
jgi:hydroxyacylglutathione hydrolase